MNSLREKYKKIKIDDIELITNKTMKQNLLKLKQALEEDNFDAIDYIIEYLQSPNVEESDREQIQDIIDEATLYLELKDKDYKNEALKLI